MEKGWLKIYRKIIDWEWYTDVPVRVLFEHCLFKANIKDKNWKGKLIKRGSFVTSYENLAFETGLTVRQTRTALSKLKMTGELTHQTTNQYSMIIVNNYEQYQPSDTQIDTQATNERQTNDKQATTTKEYKEYKNEKNNKLVVVVGEDSEKNYGEYLNVHLTKAQHDKLLSMCASQKFLNEIIDAFSINIEVGKEMPYKEELPNAHFERLKSYYNYRRKHPDIFVKADKQSVWEELAEKYKDLKV